MKKNILAIAIAATFVAPIVSAGAPTVYGIAAMEIRNTDNVGTEVVSRASRLGVKGSEQLGNGLRAIYKMEFGLDLSGVNNGLTARNQYVGLSSSFGTVLMGSHDTPLKMSQPTDLFNDGAYDNARTSMVLANGGEIRGDKVLAYVSPSFGGAKIVAAAISGTTNADDLAAPEDFELADAYSVAAMYGSTKKGLYAAVAYNGGDAFNESEEIRASVQYKTGILMANLMWQDQSNMGSNITASASYKMGKLKPKIKYSTTTMEKTVTMSSYSPTVYAIGLDYALGKKTTAYVEYGSASADIDGVDDTTVSSIGLQHKF